MALLPDLIRLPKLIREEDLYIEGSEYGREDDPHVTLLYGLKTDDPKEVKTKIEAWFGTLTEVELQGVGCFEPEERPFDVVKINIALSSVLGSMNKALRELPFENDFPDYHPHATLAYVKKGLGKNYVGLKTPKIAKVSKIVFSDSSDKKTTLWKP